MASLTLGERSFSKYAPKGFELEVDKEEDDWWRVKFLIYGFTEAFSNMASIYLNIGDDSMCAIRFRTTSKGNVPHLSYIFRNPEPLGEEFNKLA